MSELANQFSGFLVGCELKAAQCALIGLCVWPSRLGTQQFSGFVVQGGGVAAQQLGTHKPVSGFSVIRQFVAVVILIPGPIASLCVVLLSLFSSARFVCVHSHAFVIQCGAQLSFEFRFAMPSALMLQCVWNMDACFLI